MRIQFTTGVAGARFAYEPGDEVELPAKDALPFVRAGQATVLRDGDVERAVEAPAETAARRGGKRRTLKNLGGLLPG